MTAERRDFARQRWSLFHAILADPAISCGGKNVAASLLTRFANAKTGRCRIRYADVAAAVAMKQDTVYRCVRQLVAAGYLVEIERGRGAGTYSFVSVSSVPENVHHIGAEAGYASDFWSEFEAESTDVHPENSDADPGNSDVHPKPPTPPYKDTPSSSKSSKAAQASARPQTGFQIRTGSVAEEEWNGWLIRHCYPPLILLGRRWPGDPAAYDVPMSYPPGRDCPQWRHQLAHRYVEDCLAERKRMRGAS